MFKQGLTTPKECANIPYLIKEIAEKLNYYTPPFKPLKKGLFLLAKFTELELESMRKKVN